MSEKNTKIALVPVQMRTHTHTHTPTLTCITLSSKHVSLACAVKLLAPAILWPRPVDGSAVPRGERSEARNGSAAGRDQTQPGVSQRSAAVRRPRRCSTQNSKPGPDRKRAALGYSRTVRLVREVTLRTHPCVC